MKANAATSGTSNDQLPTPSRVIAELAASQPPSYPIEPFLLGRLERKGQGQLDE